MMNLPRNRFARFFRPGLALIGAAVLLPLAMEAQEMRLELTDITTSSSMAGVRGPVRVFLEMENGSVTAARAMARHDVADGEYNGNGGHVPADASSLTLSGGVLSGSLTANLPVGGGSASPLEVVLSANVAGDDIDGTHSGTYAGANVEGNVRGSLVAETSLPQAGEAGLFLEAGQLETDNGALVTSPQPLHLRFGFSGGAVETVEASSGRVMATLYNPDPSGRVVDLVGPLGNREYGLLRYDRVTGAANPSGTVGLDTFTAEVEVTFAELSGRVFRYIMQGEVIGNAVLGTYEVKESGATVTSGYSFLGYIGEGGGLPSRDLPELDRLPAGPAIGHAGFSPPYFGGLAPAEIRERVRAGALWLTETPEVAVFGVPSAHDIDATGTKQYDNAAFNAYGGATAFGVLQELSADAELQQHARQAAENAGYWIDAVGEGNYRGLATYYKQMFFVSVWGPLAHMELYEFTGEPRWRAAVEGYLAMLEDEVTTRMNGPEVQDFAPDDGVPAGRTWTYLDEGTGAVGKSSSRYDRSRDNFELNPGPFLWLLGKLRVDHGVTRFVDFEDKARAWVEDNIDDDLIWGGGTGEAEAEGLLFYGLYLLDYAPQYDPVLMDKVVAHVENNLVDWSHPVSDDGLADQFAPHVKNQYPRWASGYLPTFVAGTAETSRMALIYLKRYGKDGDSTDLAKAHALAHSVLRTQNPDTGMIHHLGIPDFSGDHQVRIFEGPNGTEPDALGNPNGRLDQHPYSALKANTLRNLLQYAEELEALGLDCSQPQEITAAEVIEKDPADAPFELNASAESGLPVRYQYVYGPASLDGSTVTLDGVNGIVKIVASQEGDTTWCAATPVPVFISVGDNTPAAPTGLTAVSGSASTTQLSWEDNAEKERVYVVQRRQAGETQWNETALLPADTTAFIDENLSSGTSYEYRVIARNRVADSAPSAVAATTTLGDEVYLFLEVECGDIGTGYEVRDNPEAGGGQDVVTIIEQKDRADVDPATVVTYEFYVPETGNYRLWLRGRAIEGGSSDSVWLMVDDGIHVVPDTFYTQPVCNTGYCWKPNNDTFPLDEGMHTITIAVRESNAVLDRFMLTTNTDNLTGFGVGGPAINCPQESVPVAIRWDADDESMILDFPSEDGVDYQLETSTTLLEGSWSASGPVVTGNGQQLELRRFLNGEKRFFRVVRVP